jgi:DNA-binding transcriptional LysR family regulator
MMRVSPRVRAPKSMSVPSGWRVAATGSPGSRPRITNTQHIHVAVPTHHRLAAAAKLRLEELADETFIANPPSYNLRQLTEIWCDEAGYTPNIAIEVTEFGTIRGLISRGLGIALLPHDDRTPPGITEIPLTGGRYCRHIALAWGTTTQAAPTRRLNDYLLQHFA